MALLPAATCPACLGAYFGVLSAVGLGFLLTNRVLVPVIVGFLVLDIASIAWSTGSHGRLGPLIVTLAGSGAVVAGRLIWSVPAMLYAGVALLAAASLWNLWLKRAVSSLSFNSASSGRKQQRNEEANHRSLHRRLSLL